LLRWLPSQSSGTSTNTVVIVVNDNGSPALSSTNSFRITVEASTAAPEFAGAPELVGNRLRLRIRIRGTLRLEASGDLADWSLFANPSGSEGSIANVEVPVEAGFRFFRLVRDP
jgi:hypothetical protein